MKLLLDTHTFLWWTTDDPQLSATALELIGNSRNTLYDFLCPIRPNNFCRQNSEGTILNPFLLLMCILFRLVAFPATTGTHLIAC